MALKSNTIKALFGKLAPLADDAVGAVAKYGDDALALANKVDDVLPPASVADIGAQQALKERLIDKRLPYDHFTFIKPPAAASKASAEFVEGFNDPMTWGRFPRYTKTLGAVDTDLFSIGDSIVPKGGAVKIPEMPTSDLVVDRGQHNDWRERGFELRPHKNTALGKWYSKNVVPVDSTRSILDYSNGTGSLMSAEDQDALIDFLDTEDMLKRVTDATYGSIPGISDSDALLYVSKMPDLEYVDPNTVEYLHNALSKRYDTSKKLQSTFGQAPSSFASNDEYSNAISSLFDVLNKLPF